ncbi:MAG: very short patch repair endonuclease [Dehalococcoidia bacterium]|nr:very short patch repair endonuclease [Dehalococcoidia bacterium]
MPDNLTTEQRRYCMSHVKGKDTIPELRVRSALHRRGLRFRKHVSMLPGKPDIVFSRARVVVFVDGDFWHGYGFESWGGKISEFWHRKIQATMERDWANRSRLVDMGWTVVGLWQHDLKNDFDGSIERVVHAVREGYGVHASSRGKVV